MEFIKYDNLDDMLKALEGARLGADAVTEEWQEDFSVGDCFVQHTDMGFDVIAEIKETNPEGRLKNYYFCDAYSVACPNGELGDIHASVISARLPRSVFEAYKEEIQS